MHTRNNDTDQSSEKHTHTHTQRERERERDQWQDTYFRQLFPCVLQPFSSAQRYTETQKTHTAHFDG
eukprot:COSAG05_NODE_3696_length_1898_cov_2.775987_2_plen_67_part_00